MFNCQECHLFEINTLWKSVLPQTTHPTLIHNTSGKSFTFTASWMSCFPQHLGLSRLDRWFKAPFQKFTNVMVQCLIGPRFFRFNEFIKLSYFALLLNVWSMVNFRFQNILNRKLMNIFISVPKHSIHQIMSTSTGINKTRYDLQTASRFCQDINRFSRFFVS